MNLFADLPEDLLKTEQFDTLLEKSGVKIERIISSGQATPDGEYYDQAWDEWVVLLQGTATIELLADKQTVTLAAGDNYWLPAGCRHRVIYTSSAPKAIWLAVHIGLKT
ncbi:cupin domain-containing protein [Pontibacter sp. JAM-7]|uniref:cupin domain-containing protein n=1 Tax=Pontibacter sp. JAM-7 TaxID=3366581 RepID=UPI003AF76D14